MIRLISHLHICSINTILKIGSHGLYEAKLLFESLEFIIQVGRSRGGSAGGGLWWLFFGLFIVRPRLQTLVSVGKGHATIVSRDHTPLYKM